MKELKFLNICYDTKALNTEFSSYISSRTDTLLKYENNDELIDIINTKDIHFVITNITLNF